MARKVFFSFHYERDSQRAAQVRNADMLADEDEYGVIDAVGWEKLEREGDDAIKRWIQSQLNGTSVTVVLIGAETAKRPWILYEIEESWKRGNGILGVKIHNVKDLDGETDTPGENPLDQIQFTDGTVLSSAAKTYDWVADNGREHLGDWVENAFKNREDMTESKEIGKVSSSGKSTDAYAGLSARYPTKPTVIKNPPRPWAM